VLQGGFVCRIPYHIHEQIARITTAKAELVKKLRRQPTAAELSEATGLSVEKMQEALSANSTVGSLETAAVGDDDGAAEIKDMLAVSAGPPTPLTPSRAFLKSTSGSLPWSCVP
jgi:DNA-directed RNA polymerase sigma subunit (sigma70/sigma32)